MGTLTTALHRRWLSATQNQQPVICTINRLVAARILAANGEKEKFECPACEYSGAFLEFKGRKSAICPGCGLLERHRLQQCVLWRLARDKGHDFKPQSILHVAPEPHFERLFRQKFAHYTSCDITGRNVDWKADLCALPFLDESFDVVYASHVLEHIQDDRLALLEIHRVLRPGGFAVLPVPIFEGIQTQEYPHAIPTETHHWRQPGTLDYFARHRVIFDRVDQYSSNDFPAIYQLYSLEDRSGWPTKEMPLRKSVAGLKHVDIVPVCYKGLR